MAYRVKWSLVVEYDSNDFSPKLMKNTTDGMDIGYESELNGLFENWVGCFEVRTDFKFMRCDLVVLAQRKSILQLQVNMIFLRSWLLISSLFYRKMRVSWYLK